MKQALLRFLLAAAGGLLVYGMSAQLGTALAQAPSGAICVTTYTDTNGNGQRDTGEGLLPGVNVNLITEGVIIATHLTAASQEPYCFETLLPGIYTVIFTDSPTYRATTSNEGTFALESGQRLTLDPFGAAPIPLANLRAEVAAQVIAAQPKDEPIGTSTRLLLSTAGSMVVMLFMIGVGAVLLAMSDQRAARRRPPRPSAGSR